MELQPVEHDPVEASERGAKAAQGPALVKVGFVMVAGAPLLMALGALMLFGVIPGLSKGPVPFVLLGVGMLELLSGALLVVVGKKRSAEG